MRRQKLRVEALGAGIHPTSVRADAEGPGSTRGRRRAASAAAADGEWAGR